MTVAALESRSVAHALPSLGDDIWSAPHADEIAMPNVTLGTSGANFEGAGELLSSRPIRPPKRLVRDEEAEDRIDCEIAQRRLDEIAAAPSLLVSGDELNDALAILRQ